MKVWHSLPHETHGTEIAGPLAALEEHFTTLAPEEILDVADSLPEALPPDRTLPVQRMLFRQLAHDAPDTAAGLTESLEPGLPREVLRLEVVLAWAEKDWPGAAGWVARWPAGLTDTRAVALRAMRTFLADADPQTLESWISGLAENPAAAAILTSALSEKPTVGSQRGLEDPLRLTLPQ
jgi:hypothetical protein